MGRKAALGLIVAALSAGAGVAIASTQGTTKHVQTPMKAPANTAVHHCHQSPAAQAAV